MSAEAPSIAIDGLSRWFGGVVAVSGVTLAVEPGVTALLGPNGAGKTTLLRAIAGLVAPSEGTARVFGQPVRGNREIYRRIGYMPEHESVYDFLTGRQFVELAARLQEVPDHRAAAERAIATVDLAAAQDRELKGYSRGMRQRMRLAATLVHDPDLLLLDEPLSGTDPVQRLHLRDVIRGLAAEGRTVLVSSHILEEVEELADSIHLMVGGKLAASGEPRAIRQKLNDRPYVRAHRLLAPARARGRNARARVDRLGRDRRGGPPARAQPQRRAAPARAAGRGAAARREAAAGRAARRLARKRLRVPRARLTMAAIFSLTVRQLGGSRKIWLVLGLVSLPVLAALLFQVADSSSTPDEFADDITRTLIASAILPLVILLLATAATRGNIVTIENLYTEEKKSISNQGNV